MLKKRREEDLEFVGRYQRAKRQQYQRVLLERLSKRLDERPFDHTVVGAATQRRDGVPSQPEGDPSLRPPWQRREPTPYGTIPLQGEVVAPLPASLGGGDVVRPVGEGVDGGPAVVDADGQHTSSNWLEVEFGGTSTLTNADPDEEPFAGSGVERADGSAPSICLEHLDSVVHDFVAAIDQRAPAAAGDGVSPHAAAFRRLLETSRTSTGQILGPPVLFGASPPMGLENVLGLLSSMRETGVLHVEAGDMTFTISIVKGDVVHGVSSPRPSSELLGNVLVSLGTIDEGRLSRFFEVHGSSPSTIAQALDREALVSTKELGRALEHQLRLLFDRLFSTRNAVWCFRAGEATLAYINMRLSVIGILLDNARKADEQSAA